MASKSGRYLLLAVAALLAVAPAVAAANARGWPHPAAGKSASGDPEVLFTFDDGPNARYTKLILHDLDEHHDKAIFNWVGRRVEGRSRRARARQAMVRLAVRDGDIVGDHTLNHDHLCLVDPATAAHEIDRARYLLRRESGLPILLFRSPYGDHCRRLVRMLRARHLRNVGWDIDPQEWLDGDAHRTAANIIAHIKHLRARDRAVVLMHDTHLATVRALPVVLKWIDAENRRRRASGRPPIRVITGSDIVADQLPPHLLTFLRGTSAGFEKRVGRSLAALVPGYDPRKLSMR